MKETEETETNTENNIEKAQKFLKYIGNNLQKLKQNLRKNITYDEDIFDDVISESIIKIYNSIVKNGTEVTDYERYFYIVSKFTYIYRDNKNQHKNEREVRDILTNGRFDVIDEDDESEERFNQTLTVLDKIKQHLTDIFGELKATVYLDYVNRKTNNRTSYKKMSIDYGISVKEISEMICEIKEYINHSKEINNIKKQYKII